MIAATQPDQIPTTGAFVPFIAAALRIVVPRIPEAIWAFFCIATAHRDELNLLYPGTRAFMAAGYRADDVEPFYERCIAYGLLRVVQERGRDALGRWLPTVYQANPLLIQIDPTRHAAALSIGGAGFCPLPGMSPDPDLRVKADQAAGVNLDQVESNLRGNPDPDLREQSGSGSLMQEAESESRIKKGESKEESKEESDKQNQTPRNVEPHHARSATQPENGAYRSTAKSGSQTRAAQNQNPARSAPNTPHSPPASPSDRTLEPFRAPLALRTDELIAQLFVRTVKNTRIEYARMYVYELGGDAVTQALTRYQTVDEEKKKKFTSPTGIVVSWAREAKAAQQPESELYDIGDPFQCQLAAFDQALPEDERSTFWDAFKAVHRGAKDISQPELIYYEDETAEGFERYKTRSETDEEILIRIAAAVQQHRATKGMR